MDVCLHCGASVPADASRCAVCGADRSDGRGAAAEPLPPLPDGGLAAALPAWLREPPVAEPAAPLLTEADLPPWLLALASRDHGDGNANGAASDALTAASSSAMPRIAPLFLPDAPLPPAAVPSSLAAATPAADAAPQPDQGESARGQRVGLAVTVLVIVLALLILLAWASGVRVPGAS
jgi:hypothetical protein